MSPRKNSTWNAPETSSVARPCPHPWRQSWACRAQASAAAARGLRSRHLETTKLITGPRKFCSFTNPLCIYWFIDLFMYLSIYLFICICIVSHCISIYVFLISVECNLIPRSEITIPPHEFDPKMSRSSVLNVLWIENLSWPWNAVACLRGGMRNVKALISIKSAALCCSRTGVTLKWTESRWKPKYLRVVRNDTALHRFEGAPKSGTREF